MASCSIAHLLKLTRPVCTNQNLEWRATSRQVDMQGQRSQHAWSNENTLDKKTQTIAETTNDRQDRTNLYNDLQDAETDG